MKTRITDLFGIEHPIIGGAMMYLSRARLVAAISEAGALGVMASAMFPTRELFAEELCKVKDLTGKPVAVNLNLFPAMRQIDNREYLEALVAGGVGIVETSGFSLPEDLVADIKSAGLKWMHKCVGPRYALKAERMGADAVTVVGYENGGATGKLDIGTLVLIPAVRDAVKIPLIGGGGIADGRGMAACLALGADGVILGTRFVLASECEIHENVRKTMCDAAVTDTTLVMRSIGFAHRVLENEAARKVIEVEARGGGLEEMLPHVSGKLADDVYLRGEVDRGMIYCSQAVGLMREVLPAAEIVRGMVGEAEGILDRLKS